MVYRRASVEHDEAKEYVKFSEHAFSGAMSFTDTLINLVLGVYVLCNVYLRNFSHFQV